MTADVERAIGRLKQRLERVGVEPVVPPRDTSDLDELIGELGPIRLPDDLEHWWQNVDVGSLPLSPFPQPCTPAFALTSWRSQRDEFVGVTPLCLIPAAYEAQFYLSVEGLHAGHPSGDVYRWCVTDGAYFRFVLPSWAELIECYVDVLDAGAFELRLFDSGQETVLTDDEILDAAMRTRAIGKAPRNGLGTGLLDLRDPSDWPANWQASTGIDLATKAPRGWTLMIGEILELPAGGRVEGTIVGRVVGLSGTAGAQLAVVDDGTGRIDVHCPASTTNWGLRMKGDFEFDVVAETGIDNRAVFDEAAGLHHDAVTAARTGDLAAATEAAAELARRTHGHRPSAVASGVRPAGPAEQA